MASGPEATIKGTVEAEASHAVVVRARFHVPGEGTRELPQREAQSFEIVTKDNTRITVTCAPTTEIEPAREAAGPWRELKQHPIHPIGDFHPDGHLKITGHWVLPGDQVHVFGEVTAQEFVPDTGGEREAPEQRISAVRAYAIGIGEHAEQEATKALRAYNKKPKAKAAPIDPRTWKRAATVGAFAVAALLLVLEAILHAGTLGLGVTAAFCGVLFLWWSTSELVPIPGGAEGEDLRRFEPGLSLIFLPASVMCSLVLFWISSPAGRNGAGAIGTALGGLLMIGISGLWTNSLRKPRAVAGHQTMLPASKVVRWIVVGGCTLLVLAAFALSISAMVYLMNTTPYRRY